MSIILEGPNGSGKSTLGFRLGEATGLGVVHAGIAPKSRDEAIFRSREQIRSSNVILDRVTPISDYVYRMDNLPENLRTLYDAFNSTLSKSHVIIYCTADGKFTKKDYYTDDHYEEIVKNRLAIRNRYDEVMSKIPHIKYNFRSDDHENFIQFIKLHCPRYL